MGTATTTFTLTVTGAQDSVVAKIKQSLVSEFGTSPGWSNQLSTPLYLASNHPDRPVGSTTINQTIRPDGQAGTLAYPPGLKCWTAWNGIGPYGPYELLPGDGGPNKSQYDPVNQNWWHITGTTERRPWSLTMVRYSLQDDEFRHWQGVPAMESMPEGSPDLFPGYGGPHSFGQSCIDVVGRRLYRGLNDWTTGVQLYNLGWVDLDNPENRGVLPAQYNGGALYPELAFFPGMGAGTGSVIATFTTANLYRPHRYDVQTGAWENDIVTSVSTPERVASAFCNGALWFTERRVGDVTQWCRLNADKTIDVIGVTPVRMNSGGNWRDQPGHTEMAALGTKIYAFWAGLYDGTDGPHGGIYVFDTETELWSGPVDACPARTSDAINAAYIIEAFTVAADTTNNVILWAGMQSTSNDHALVWKPPG